MLLRFGFFLLVLFFIVYFLYYRKTHRRDYFFTLVLLSVSIFFLIYLLGSVKVKIGFALGLFAIFGVLRYRTETIPVREMSYMFGVISLSVINALADSLSAVELLIPNIAIALLIWFFEACVLRRNLASKLILYDRIELITPERREELLEDLHKRTGLNITKVTIGSIDFLKDTAVINALADSLSAVELLIPNIAIALLIWFFEACVLRRNLASKLILYDRIELITPERREELLEDLHKRTGLNITKVTIGSIDFLKDTAVIKIDYENDGGGGSHINNTLKIPKYEWQDVKENN